MGIRVDGARQLNQSLLAASGRFDKATIGVLRRAAVKVRRRQKELAGVASGDMKRSITYTIRGTTWRRTARIGPKLAEKYPIYQEVGTARMAANPFVEPSLQGVEQDLADGLDGLVGEVLR